MDPCLDEEGKGKRKEGEAGTVQGPQQQDPERGKEMSSGNRKKFPAENCPGLGQGNRSL